MTVRLRTHISFTCFVLEKWVRKVELGVFSLYCFLLFLYIHKMNCQMIYFTKLIIAIEVQFSEHVMYNTYTSRFVRKYLISFRFIVRSDISRRYFWEGGSAIVEYYFADILWEDGSSTIAEQYFAVWRHMYIFLSSFSANRLCSITLTLLDLRHLQNILGC